jgi:hypothetical protein
MMTKKDKTKKDKTMLISEKLLFETIKQFHVKFDRCGNATGYWWKKKNINCKMTTF